MSRLRSTCVVIFSLVLIIKVLIIKKSVYFVKGSFLEHKQTTMFACVKIDLFPSSGLGYPSVSRISCGK